MDPRTIYFNHAGTSWPKPELVSDAVDSVLHSDPTTWPARFESAHQDIANFFHVEGSRLLLTPSCTAALSLAVTDHNWQPGDRVLTSGYEHHALHRSLVQLEAQGVKLTALPRASAELIDLSALENELARGKVRLVAITAACNVTGQLLPINEVIRLAHQYSDGAQIAGWWDLDLPALGADLFTFAGHKGPQAPWGIGGLYVAPQISMHSPQAHCEVATAQRCTSMPGYCDAGSVNLLALAGMQAACQWLSDSQQGDRLLRARQLGHDFAELLGELPNIVLHASGPFAERMPTVACSHSERPASELARELRDRGVVCSGGLQCAPQAHTALGTSRLGVVRFSFGPTNRPDELIRARDILAKVLG